MSFLLGTILFGRSACQPVQWAEELTIFILGRIKNKIKICFLGGGWAAIGLVEAGLGIFFQFGGGVWVDRCRWEKENLYFFSQTPPK